MPEKKKTVAVFIRGFHNGGIEKVFERYFNYMDLTPYEIHFVTHMKNDAEKKKIFTDMGCIIHELSPLRGHKLTKKNFSEYQELFQKNHFDIVHNNTPDNLLPLKYAVKAGVGVRILHAHNDYTRGYSLKQKLLSPLYKFGFALNTSRANCLIGVSKQAAVSAFGKRAGESILLPNAIDLQLFRFDASVRAEYRRKLGIADDAILFGHVGRYENDQKNQEFVLSVFQKYHQTHQNARIVMIGDGKRRPEFEQMAKDLGIADSVVFTGNVPNVPDYLCAMDVYLFPSRKEGLGIAAVEAQASGLYTIISETVPEEVLTTDHAEFLPIAGEGAEARWLEGMDRAAAWLASRERTDSIDQVAAKGYDIHDQKARLEQIYAKA